ncbi:pilus assembly protein PilS [Neisseria meningitidis]|nr:pilus assembly protein PilS [Neisseria meningitidis]
MPSFPRTCTTSFPRKWESSSFGFACFKFRVTSTSSFPRTCIPSFPRKWESRTQNLKKPFYPISFRTDRPRFPPARE